MTPKMDMVALVRHEADGKSSAENRKSAIHCYSISHQPNALRSRGRGHGHWQPAFHVCSIGDSVGCRIFAGNSLLAPAAATLRTGERHRPGTGYCGRSDRAAQAKATVIR